MNPTEILISHNDAATRRNNCDSNRITEACGRARAVGEGATAATRKCGDGTTGVRNTSDAAIVGIGHDDAAI
jgi:hypothetical protein